MKIEPVTLESNVVRLEPLQKSHAHPLFLVGQDSTIWRYIPFPEPTTEAAFEDWIDVALRAQEVGRELPFVIIERTTGRAVGSTRYLNIMAKDRGLEIGSTWLTQDVRRTAVNTACKYLLLGYAFEKLEAIRVQFKTDSRNVTSQRAIERLGATKEGTLRNHVIMPDGYYRHSVYYSIIDSEWQTVKKYLEEKLQPGSSV
jgi:RimJ/RimL family protein N-acetyltransferase